MYIKQQPVVGANLDVAWRQGEGRRSSLLWPSAPAQWNYGDYVQPETCSNYNNHPIPNDFWTKQFFLSAHLYLFSICHKQSCQRPRVWPQTCNSGRRTSSTLVILWSPKCPVTDWCKSPCSSLLPPLRTAPPKKNTQQTKNSHKSNLSFINSFT